MIDSVREKLINISEYSQNNILLHENEYENVAFQHGIVVFKSLLFDMVYEFLKGINRRCNDEETGNKVIKYSKYLSNPDELKYSQRYFHLAICLNECISDKSHRIYATKMNGHFKTVKFDFDQMNVSELINSKFFNIGKDTYLSLEATYDNIIKLLYMAYKNELGGPYFDKKTIIELGEAYVAYVINKKVPYSFQIELKENAKSIYDYIYSRLVSEYLESSYEPKYVVKIELMNYDYVIDNFIIRNNLKDMIDLFDNSAYDDDKDQILFPVLIQENGKKLFLPVRKSYFRSLFEGDSAYGFDSNQCNLYSKNIIDNELFFTFDRPIFEAKVAGLKRIRKPSEKK